MMLNDFIELQPEGKAINIVFHGNPISFIGEC